MKYLVTQPTARKTPQSQPIPGREKDMTQNAAGGFAFTADSWTRMERFLILGSEGGTFYVGEQDLTKQNIDNVRACIGNDARRAIKLITDISLNGRAPKNDPAIYALAVAASSPDDKTRAMALTVLPSVCRTGTDLFTFAAFVQEMRGWGKGLRHAVASWYLDKNPKQLAYQLVKYQQRNGWSHRDLLRLAHPKPTDFDRMEMLRWAVKSVWATQGPLDGSVITGYEKAKGAGADVVASLIRQYGLTREMIPTEVQKSPVVWEALLEEMPLGAMVRTLGRMGAAGLLVPFSAAVTKVALDLTNREMLRLQRVHPIRILAALLTYKTGHGQKGSLQWPVVPQVVDALNEAFYMAFEFVKPTGKRFLLGIDVSASMGGGVVAGMAGLTPRMGAAAMAMLAARTEPNYFIGGFATSFVDLGISRSDRLDMAMSKADRSFGGTDCAVAMNYALAHKIPVDVFEVITDGETWAGDIHAAQAIREYREKTGIDAKLVVLNMVPNRSSLSDPTDPGSLDVVGFDASVPSVISTFVTGQASEPAADER